VCESDEEGGRKRERGRESALLEPGEKGKKGRTSTVQLHPRSSSPVHHPSSVRERLHKFVDLLNRHRAGLGELGPEGRRAPPVTGGDGGGVDFDGGLTASVGELGEDEGTLFVVAEERRREEEEG
jgi:hypothetical protein